MIQEIIHGRSPESLVIWLDDWMFDVDLQRSIVHNSLFPGGGDPKGTLLHGLRTATQYGLILSDECEKWSKPDSRYGRPEPRER